MELRKDPVKLPQYLLKYFLKTSVQITPEDKDSNDPKGFIHMNIHKQLFHSTGHISIRRSDEILKKYILFRCFFFNLI